jgi:hypothetical protein
VQNKNEKYIIGNGHVLRYMRKHHWKWACAQFKETASQANEHVLSSQKKHHRQ